MACPGLERGRFNITYMLSGVDRNSFTFAFSNVFYWKKEKRNSKKTVNITDEMQ
jgi:hypothetical protein